MDLTLDQLRQEIDAVDTELLQLLAKRCELAIAVGHVKQGKTIFRPEREMQILRRLNELNDSPLSSQHISAIFREIISACRSLEKNLVVAYLGPTGTFSEQAVLKQFGQSIELLPCSSIDEVFRVTENKTVDFGVVPIENSTEGVVNRTLDLLLKTPLYMASEIVLPINHCLLHVNGTTESLSKVTKICGHAQALAQCHGWISQHYPQLERYAVSSNAEGAKMASQDESIVAIASDAAANRYDLTILNKGIQDDSQNRTRFILLAHQATGKSGHDQTSLVMSVKNRAGAVYELLEPLARLGVSMLRIESRPARSNQWEYFFFVDIEGHQESELIQNVLQELEEKALFFKVLGSYPIPMDCH